MYTTELYHYGVKGMKWGVRRYQTADGSLTDRGRRKILESDKGYKILKKAVHKQRGKLHGGSNRWMRGVDIGSNSKSVFDRANDNRKKYENTPEYKSWSKKVDKLSRKGENGFETEAQIKAYEKEWASLMRQKPKKNFNDTNWVYVSGKGYADNYLKKGGKDVTMAYLKDLNFNDSTAKEITDSLIKKNKTLGAV